MRAFESSLTVFPPPSSRVGSLEAGKDADIAIFDGNPLRDIQCHTKAVFVNGEEVLSQIKTRV